jgi:hypothetical protein
VHFEAKKVIVEAGSVAMGRRVSVGVLTRRGGAVIQGPLDGRRDHRRRRRHYGGPELSGST